MIDVSSWEIDVKRQASGTRAKFWIIEPLIKPAFCSKFQDKIRESTLLNILRVTRSIFGI